MVAIAPDTLKSRLQTAPEGKYTGVRQVFVDMVSLKYWCASGLGGGGGCTCETTVSFLVQNDLPTRLHPRSSVPLIFQVPY